MAILTPTTDKGQFEIQGAGFYYQFPDNFDIVTETRRNEIAGRDVPGRDGVSIDNTAVRRSSLELIISGRIQADSIASAQIALNSLQRAINQVRAGDTYIVDRKNDRRIAVRLHSSRIPREPSFMLDTTLVFETTTDPYWQDTNPIIVEKTDVSDKMTRWINCEIGSAPSHNLDMIISTRATAISNPTILRGNWAFYGDCVTGNASCVNTTNVWGNIKANTTGDASIINTKYGPARRFSTSSPTLTWGDTLNIRPWPLTFRFDIIAQSNATSADMYFFTLGSPGYSSNRRWDAFWRGSNNFIFIRTSGITQLTGALPTITPGSLYSIMGILDYDRFTGYGDGTIATLWMGMLFCNGKVIGTAKSMANTPSTLNDWNKLWVGTRSVLTEHFEHAIQKAYFWQQNLGEDFCKSNWNVDLKPDNKVLKWSGTISTPNRLRVQHETGQIHFIDTSSSSMAVATMSGFSGEFFGLGDSSGYSGDNYTMRDTLFVANQNHYVSVSYRKNHF